MIVTVTAHRASRIAIVLVVVYFLLVFPGREHSSTALPRATSSEMSTRALALDARPTLFALTPARRARRSTTRGRSTRAPAASLEAADTSDDDAATRERAETIDLDGMRRETRRRIERALKKVSKATTKLRVAREKVEELSSREAAATEARARARDVDGAEAELMTLKRELGDLNALNDILRGCKTVNSPKFLEEAYPLATALAVRDAPPARPPRVKKVKGPKQATKPRMPYWTFVSADGIDIRVGRTSSDNDSVSCDPKCRDSRDWWMHAAGCPGSHVVIRYTGDDLPAQTKIDAAVLAAKNSKANQVGRAKVSLVRCRQVSKPRGAKPGLVQLSGDIRTVTVNVKDESERLERLLATKT